ncbi:hypothetical protein Dimus_007100 [Dionaea muscipula]
MDSWVSRDGRKIGGEAWGDCEEQRGSPYLRAVQKGSPDEQLPPNPLSGNRDTRRGLQLSNVEERDSELGQTAAGFASAGTSPGVQKPSSTAKEGVAVSTKGVDDWQVVVNKKGKQVSESRFSVLQPQQEAILENRSSADGSFLKEGSDLRELRGLAVARVEPWLGVWPVARVEPVAWSPSRWLGSEPVALGSGPVAYGPSTTLGGATFTCGCDTGGEAWLLEECFPDLFDVAVMLLE